MFEAFVFESFREKGGMMTSSWSSIEHFRLFDIAGEYSAVLRLSLSVSIPLTDPALTDPDDQQPL